MDREGILLFLAPNMRDYSSGTTAWDSRHYRLMDFLWRTWVDADGKGVLRHLLSSSHVSSHVSWSQLAGVGWGQLSSCITLSCSELLCEVRTFDPRTPSPASPLPSDERSRIWLRYVSNTSFPSSPPNDRELVEVCIEHIPSPLPATLTTHLKALPGDSSSQSSQHPAASGPGSGSGPLPSQFSFSSFLFCKYESIKHFTHTAFKWLFWSGEAACSIVPVILAGCLSQWVSCQNDTIRCCERQPDKLVLETGTWKLG